LTSPYLMESLYKILPSDKTTPMTIGVNTAADAHEYVPPPKASARQISLPCIYSIVSYNKVLFRTVLLNSVMENTRLSGRWMATQLATKGSKYESDVQSSWLHSSTGGLSPFKSTISLIFLV
jgi:hypothetical protein